MCVFKGRKVVMLSAVSPVSVHSNGTRLSVPSYHSPKNQFSHIPDNQNQQNNNISFGGLISRTINRLHGFHVIKKAEGLDIVDEKFIYGWRPAYAFAYSCMKKYPIKLRLEVNWKCGQIVKANKFDQDDVYEMCSIGLPDVRDILSELAYKPTKEYDRSFYIGMLKSFNDMIVAGSRWLAIDRCNKAIFDYKLENVKIIPFKFAFDDMPPVIRSWKEFDPKYSSKQACEDIFKKPNKK